MRWLLSLLLLITSPAWAGGFSNGPIGWFEMCRRGDQPIDFCATRPAMTVKLDGKSIGELIVVNIEVNYTIEQTADIEVYGKEEFWTVPLEGKGDCEDLVLEKIMRLRKAGFPAGSMVIIAGHSTLSGEGHAVLGVRTDGGLLVLDNLTDDIGPLEKAKIRPKLIQKADNPTIWEYVNGKSNRD